MCMHRRPDKIIDTTRTRLLLLVPSIPRATTASASLPRTRATTIHRQPHATANPNSSTAGAGKATQIGDIAASTSSPPPLAAHPTHPPNVHQPTPTGPSAATLLDRTRRPLSASAPPAGPDRVGGGRPTRWRREEPRGRSSKRTQAQIRDETAHRTGDGGGESQDEGGRRETPETTTMRDKREKNGRY
ncbi:hypothetical protein C8Q77DRAFT_102338 [Trametes polyzona]|nr:hypothetical protein C8Q77DRAFT_102338 [Trametes polyzona]